MTEKLPLLFVPGLSCNRGLWENQLNYFDDYAETWVAPLPELDDLGRIAEEILAEAPAQFAAVGLSMGGYICFEMYKRAPERFLKLGLMSTSVSADDTALARRRRLMVRRARQHGVLKTWREAMERMVHPDRAQDKAFLDRLVRMTFEVGAEAFCKHQIAMAGRPDYSPVAQSVTCPTTIIAGEGDVATPVACHLQIANMIPHATFNVIPNAGHLPPLEAPDLVNMHLRDWLFDAQFAVAAE